MPTPLAGAAIFLELQYISSCNIHRAAIFLELQYTSSCNIPRAAIYLELQYTSSCNIPRAAIYLLQRNSILCEQFLKENISTVVETHARGNKDRPPAASNSRAGSSTLTLFTQDYSTRPIYLDEYCLNMQLNICYSVALPTANISN